MSDEQLEKLVTKLQDKSRKILSRTISDEDTREDTLGELMVLFVAELGRALNSGQSPESSTS